MSCSRETVRGDPCKILPELMVHVFSLEVCSQPSDNFCVARSFGLLVICPPQHTAAAARMEGAAQMVSMRFLLCLYAPCRGPTGPSKFLKSCWGSQSLLPSSRGAIFVRGLLFEIARNLKIMVPRAAFRHYLTVVGSHLKCTSAVMM